MKRRIKWMISLISILILVISPHFQFVKSVVVMYPYSFYEHYNSLLKKENIQINMPAGLSTKVKDWYPFVMTFRGSEGFSYYFGRPVDLTILYNFGAFEYLKGASTFYNQQSDYFNAFYGAYVVKDENEKFGYNDQGEPNYYEIAKVPEYDMRILVLKSIGCENPVFDFEIVSTDEEVTLLGIDGWQQVNATIITNGSTHKVENNYLAYIQYGKPNKNDNNVKDFPLVEVKGRIYSRYFEEKNITVCFYVIAPNWETIEETDNKFIKKSTLDF